VVDVSVVVEASAGSDRGHGMDSIAAIVAVVVALVVVAVVVVIIVFVVVADG